MGRIQRIFRESNTFVLTPSKMYDFNNEDQAVMTDIEQVFANYEYRCPLSTESTPRPHTSRHVPSLTRLEAELERIEELFIDGILHRVEMNKRTERAESVDSSEEGRNA